MKLIVLFLTCAHAEEARKITESLLEQKLVACVKQIPITASFVWNNALDHAQEILLIMESIEEKFDAIEQVVRQLHSYQTFVLVAQPIIRASDGVKKWITESVK